MEIFDDESEFDESFDGFAEGTDDDDDDYSALVAAGRIL